MTDQRLKLLAQLNQQAEHEGETDNIAACRIIARHIQTNSEWQSLVTTVHYRHGVASFETYHFHYVHDWFASLVADLHKINWPE